MEDVSLEKTLALFENAAHLLERAAECISFPGEDHKRILHCIDRLYGTILKVFQCHAPISGHGQTLDRLEGFILSVQTSIFSRFAEDESICRIFSSVLQIMQLLDEAQLKTSFLLEISLYMCQSEHKFARTDALKAVADGLAKTTAGVFVAVPRRQSEILFLLQKKLVFTIENGEEDYVVECFLIQTLGMCLARLSRSGDCKEAQNIISKTANDVFIRNKLLKKDKSIGEGAGYKEYRLFFFLASIAQQNTEPAVHQIVFQILADGYASDAPAEYFQALNILSQGCSISMYSDILGIYSKELHSTNNDAKGVLGCVKKLAEFAVDGEKASLLFESLAEAFTAAFIVNSTYAARHLTHLAHVLPRCTMSAKMRTTLFRLWLVLCYDAALPRPFLSAEEVSCIACSYAPLLDEGLFLLMQFQQNEAKALKKIKEDISMIKTRLAALLPEHTAKITKSPSAHCLFLFVFYTHYSARLCDKQPFQGLIEYLKCHAVNKAGIFDLLGGLAGCLLSAWLDRNNCFSTEEGTTLFLSLVDLMCSRFAHVQAVGMCLVQKTIEKTSVFVFNRRILESLLERAQKLHEMAEMDFDGRLICFDDRSLIDSKADHTTKVLAMNDVAAATKTILEKTGACAPNALNCFISLRLCRNHSPRCFKKRFEDSLLFEHAAQNTRTPHNLAPKLDETCFLFSSRKKGAAHLLDKILAKETHSQKSIQRAVRLVASIGWKDTAALKRVCTLVFKKGNMRSMTLLLNLLAWAETEAVDTIFIIHSIVTCEADGCLHQRLAILHAFETTLRYGPSLPPEEPADDDTQILFLEFLQAKMQCEMSWRPETAVLYAQVLATILSKARYRRSACILVAANAVFELLCSPGRIAEHRKKDLCSCALKALLLFFGWPPRTHLSSYDKRKKQHYLGKLHTLLSKKENAMKLSGGATEILMAVCSLLKAESDFEDVFHNKQTQGEQVKITDADIQQISRHALPTALLAAHSLRVSGGMVAALNGRGKTAWTAYGPELLFRHRSFWEAASKQDICYGTPLRAMHALFVLKGTKKQQLRSYALASLGRACHDELCFFVPQLVQTLRNDTAGHVQRFILQKTRHSAKFGHKLVWNLQANLHIDGETQTKKDADFDTFAGLIQKIEQGFSTLDGQLYKREMDFIKQITGVSEALRPFLRRSKDEKKKKIAELLQTIVVDEGVYLPCDDEGTVVEIDCMSGRPLQSHAKTPFMAGFYTRNRQGLMSMQNAIFKVGDDCRQDVLTLQLFCKFAAIFHTHRLPLYLYAYRTVAMAGGRGVIEVVPNSISRDQIGREKINSLYSYFVLSFGDETTQNFLEARERFVQSVAGYSVLSYFLSLKDRHNGNILIDSRGHMIHIDFGFILGLSPGGIQLEVDFKLTPEMIQVMGGQDNVNFARFREYCIRAFLLCRTYEAELTLSLEQMVDCGLPCFSGKETLKRFAEKFRSDLSPADARRYFADITHQAAENKRTFLYDVYQNRQSGTPY
eukprot:GHVN01004384.1.p1 GENE.GHVN01004384.1~~GHVN01004384.1.p1  ORF type:complete len:1682 (-),score=142.33 GHVN01004384.1:7910-12382(-)